MSNTAVFGECDECGCVIAPSDNPERPPGSMGGIRFENGETVRTCEVRCPSCMHLAHVDMPEDVSARDVFGSASLFEHPGGGSHE